MGAREKTIYSFVKRTIGILFSIVPWSPSDGKVSYYSSPSGKGMCTKEGERELWEKGCTECKSVGKLYLINHKIKGKFGEKNGL